MSNESFNGLKNYKNLYDSLLGKSAIHIWHTFTYICMHVFIYVFISTSVWIFDKLDTYRDGIHDSINHFPCCCCCCSLLVV